MRRLLVDLTDVHEFFQVHWTVSGIQRVSLRIAQNLVQRYAARHPIALIVMGADGGPILGDAGCFATPGEVGRDEFLAAFSLPPIRTGHKVRSKRSREIRRIARKMFRPGRFAYPNGPEHGGAQPDRDRFRGAIATRADLANATILVLGGVRPIPRFWDCLDEVKEASGAKVVMTIHDLIPLKRADLVPDDQPAVFNEALHRCFRTVDRYVAVSRSVASDLAAFHRAYAYIGADVSVVPLAHEFVEPASVNPHGSAVPAPVHIKFEGMTGVPYSEAVGMRRAVSACRLTPFVLTVGTIEPRKNHVRLCRIWSDLLDELGAEAMPKLVIAGKKGYSAEDFDDLIRTTGSLGGHLRIIDAPTDAELAFLYKHCLFTVFPSLAEGWGLPVGESLWFGKLCLAARATSVPEVGGDLCDYFDPNASADMKSAILAAVRDPEVVRRKERAICRSALRRWSDVADGFWDVLAGISD